jgi:peptide/nickel transport system permease protein
VGAAGQIVPPGLIALGMPGRRARWATAAVRVGRRWPIIIGGALGLLVVSVALLAPVVSPHDPIRMDVRHRLAGPSGSHVLGTDELGRDILSRLLAGARVSLYVGVVSVGIALGLGVPLGLLGGFYRGRLDAVIMRLLDALLAFPAILLALAIVAMLKPNLTNAMIAIGIVSIPSFARLSRASVMAVHHFEYVEAARACGASDLYLVLRTILPNCLAPILIQVSVGFADAVVTEAALSFLGLGIQPPTPSWGSMLANGRVYLTDSPLYALSAGTALSVTVLSLSLLGDELRDLLDPQLRSVAGGRVSS